METITHVQQGEELLLRAIKEADIEMLDQLLSDDLQFVGPTGQVFNKADDLEPYRSGKVKIDQVTASGQNIRLIGATAIVTVQVHLKGTYINHTLDESFQYLRIWTHSEDRWQVAGGSCSKILIHNK